jgi:serine/threonine-protein kinase
LLHLLVNIAKAYATLHQQGVVHCDVHPGNVLVDQNGEVTLIDFGLADFIDGDAPAFPRGGVAFFHEPELAQAFLNRRSPPRGHPLGEQYCVAALLYLLATSHHYFDFTLESKAMLGQIIAETPRPFQDRGLEPWPALESVLARALAKQPEQRYPDMAAFADALSAITATPTKIPIFHDDMSEKLIQGMLDSLQTEGKWFKEGLETAPSCSVNMGMAGIAYALYRIATARQEPQLLALADLWLGKTLRHQDSPDAFMNKDMDVTPETIGRISPYHTASGPMVVWAMLAQSVGNLVELEFAHTGFLATIDQPPSNRDLTLGTLGVVLACALLLEKPLPADWPLVEVLRTAGQERLDQVWSEVGNFASLETAKDWANLGIAHGWAGLLFTSLRWHGVTAAPIPEGVPRRLAELSKCARPTGRGLSWPWRAEDGGGESSMPGWCNGAAGMVHLGCLAHRLLGDESYLALAEGAAWQAWETGLGIVDLCCGLAGRAYALLCLYQHSGEPAWLRRAQILAQRAARLSPSHYGPEHPRHSLYKGELGVAVLVTEIEHPESASMPMFGEEV